MTGLDDGRLERCPDTPNCVCSDEDRDSHRIEPFRLREDAGEAWLALVDVLARESRTNVVTRTDDYIHAEFRIAVFGFVDDVEFHLRPEAGVIAVRSASRVGGWDLGVNRRRVEKLRREMRRRGAVE